MPLFRYEVADKDGRIMNGVMDASSESHVRDSLISKGFTVKYVVSTAQPQPAAQPQAIPAARVGPTSGTSAPPKELAVLFRGLASYLQAGITLNQALAEFGDRTPNRGMRVICQRMAARVRAGEKLSDAMAEFPRAFPPHVVGVVAAGELGGFLPLMVGDIAVDYEIAQRASGRSLRWWSWAAWLHVYGFLLIAPVFPAFFSIGVTDVPSMLARYLSMVIPYVLVPLVVLTAAYFGTAAVLRQPSMRPIAHRLLLRVPWAGRSSRERSLATFARILWRLQQAGILPIRSWDAASRAAENVVVGAQLHAQVPAVQSGVKFSDALGATGLFTSEDQRVLASGETAGQTADVLQRIAAYYEDAALASAGRARWLGLRISILAMLLSMGVLFVCFGLFYQNMFAWVDWFFGAGNEL